MQILASMISEHTVTDIEFYVAFILGQGLFLLKRAGSAVRNPGTTIKTRWQYFTCNLDIITVRAVLEFMLFYYPFRHYSVAQIISLFGYDLTNSSNSWLQFLNTIPSSAVSAIGLGYVADSLLDGLSQWNRLPAIVQRWIKENVPTLPVNGQKPTESGITPIPKI